ncbi:NADH dehydrogenase (ubiquinone) 1 beta subcomplex, 2, 8kDa [Halictus rubicundus]|uniref:NADH dehydrogenase (ubiquinone) 1 beta subcomplex, 2, 8kDa n=1 Tax=Halictus rubicundus TaxID=77578 RepID=UPI0040363F6E
MIISRGGQIVNTVCRINARKNAAINLAQVRYEQPIYRTRIHPPRYDAVLAEIAAGIGWWWVLWFLYHDFEILTKGHIPGPVPDIFSDEELGIPPDDVD